jgi:MFS family permease
MTSQRGFFGWKLVTFLWLLDFLNLGLPLYGGSVINTYMYKQIAMSRSDYGLGFTILNICVGIPSILIGAAIVRLGVRKTFCIGSALIFCGSLWLCFVTSRPWHFWVGFGVLVATGISFGGVMPAATAVTRWFSRYRGRAMAITLSASGFAGFFVAPLLNRILVANGGNWRQTWAMVAGISVVSAAIAIFFVKERPEDLGQSVDGGMDSDSAQIAESRSNRQLVTTFPWQLLDALQTVSYWMIVAGAVACQFPFFLFTAHWLLHLKGVGVAASDAAFAMGLFTLSTVFGRLIGGWLMDRLAARYAFMLGLCCYFLGSFLAIRVSADALWIAYAAAFLYGLAFGWTFICLNTITGNYYGPSAFPLLSGLVYLVAAFFCSPAAYLAGKIFDLYHSYSRAFELNSVVVAIGIFALFFAKMPVPPANNALVEAEEIALAK